MKQKKILTTAIIFGLLFSIVLTPYKVLAQDDQQQQKTDAAKPADEKQTEPKVEGKPSEVENYPPPKVSKKELYAQVGLSILQLIIANMQKPPKPRQRGNNIDAAGCGGASYKGKCKIYQFTNDDFPNQNTCGQAAMATAMWNVGLTYNNNPQALAKAIFDFAPPKITLGNLIQLKDNLGTDWRQFNYGMDGFKRQGIKYTWIDGEAEIKKYIAMGYPVVIMLDVGTLPQYKYQWWAGHWVTAFGYDHSNIYVSNFPNNKMTWAQLNDAFRKGTLAVGHGTSGRAAVVWK